MELVISVKPDADIKTLEKQMGLKMRKNSPQTKVIYLADVDEGDYDKTVSALSMSPLVVAVEKNIGGYRVLAEAG